MATHDPKEILRHFQGSKNFPRDQGFRLEAPGCNVFDYEANPMTDEDCLTLREPLVARDREFVFSEDIIVDNSGTVDVSLPVLAKVSALVEALHLGGSYERVHQL